jgi:two-component system, response regulator PdtaR
MWALGSNTQDTPMVHSVLLVDPDEMYRRSLAQGLRSFGGRVVGEAGDLKEAMRLAATTEPDVALVATPFPSGDAVGLVGRLATEFGIPSVHLGRAADHTFIPEAADTGAMGFLVRPVDPRTIHAMLDVAVCRFRDILRSAA